MVHETPLALFAIPKTRLKNGGSFRPNEGADKANEVLTAKRALGTASASARWRRRGCEDDGVGSHTLSSAAMCPRVGIGMVIVSTSSRSRVGHDRGSIARGGADVGARRLRGLMRRCSSDVGTAVQAEVQAATTEDDSSDRFVYVGNLDFFEDPADVERYLFAALARMDPASPAPVSIGVPDWGSGPRVDQRKKRDEGKLNRGFAVLELRIRPPDAPRPRRWTARTSTAGPCGPARVSRSSRRRRRWTRRKRTKPPSRPARNDARTTGGSDADASNATPRRWRRDSTRS